MTDIDRLLELKNRLDVYYGEPKEYDETLQEYQSLYEKLKKVEIKAVRYDELQDRYLNWDEKHFGELCGLYFDDEPILKETK